MIKEGLPVVVELGMVLPLGEDKYSNIKPLISMTLDPYGEIPIEQQIETALSTAKLAFAKIDDQMSAIITDLISPISGQPSYGDRLEELEKFRKAATRNFRKIQDRLGQNPSAIVDALEDK